MKPLRILLADDHRVVRQGLRAVIASNPRWKICGEAIDGKEAVAEAKRLRPDIVVLDINLSEVDGLEATRQISRAVPHTKILIFTLLATEEVVREALNAGAHALVSKSDPDCYLLSALEALGQQPAQTFLGTKAIQMLLRQEQLRRDTASGNEHSDTRLTPRQAQIVRLLATGNTNKEVAAALGISVKTAETHRTNIMSKLALHSFSDLVRYAVRERIVEA